MNQRDVESKFLVEERKQSSKVQQIPKNMTSWLQGQVMLKLVEQCKNDKYKKVSNLDAMLDVIIASVIERNDIGAFKAVMSLVIGKGLNGADVLIKLMGTDINTIQQEMNLEPEQLGKLARNLQKKKGVIDVDPISSTE